MRNVTMSADRAIASNETDRREHDRKPVFFHTIVFDHEDRPTQAVEPVEPD